MSVSTVQAETETTSPAWKVTGATYNTVYVKDIITSPEDFTSEVLEGTSTNEAATEKTGAYTRPVVKDGQDEMVISGVAGTTTNVPFYAREGKTIITGGSDITFTNGTSAQAMLQVAGKDASLEISGEGTTVTTGPDYYGFVSIGNMDGSGTLTVTGGATLNVGATMHAGYKTTYLDGNPDGKFDYTGTAKTSLVHNATVNADGTLYADGDYVTYGEEKFGKATINVTNGGKLNIKQFIQLNEGSINVDKGTLTGVGGSSAILLGIDTARNSDLNITNGGVVDIDYVQDGSYNTIKGEGVVFTDEKMSIKINVDGNDSELRVRDLSLGIGQPNGTTAINVTGGGKITAGDLNLVYSGFDHVKNGAVQISVDASSKINVEEGIKYGSTTSGGKISMDYKTVINNAGTITATKLDMSGGELTNAGTLSAEEITISNGGSLNNSGSMTLTKDQSLIVNKGGNLTLSGGSLVVESGATLAINGTLTFVIDAVSNTTPSTAMLTSTNGANTSYLYLNSGSSVTFNPEALEITFSDEILAQVYGLEKYEGGADDGTKKTFEFSLSDLIDGAVTPEVQGAVEEALLAELSTTQLVDGWGDNYVALVGGSDNGDGTYSVTLQYVPEPATATLSLLALAGLAARRRRK